MTVLAFAPMPEVSSPKDPLLYAADGVQAAVVDYAIAIQHAQTVDRAIQIRRHIAARRLELEAIENMALEKMEAIQ